MDWTLTSAAARAGTVLGLRRRWTGAYAVSRAAGLAQRGTRAGADTVFGRVFGRTCAQASTPDRKALEAARAQLGEDAGVIERAVASGAPTAAVAGLAAAWEALPASVQSVLRDPLQGGRLGKVTFGSVHARQVDETTCGAAVMAMMLIAADPFVGLWLMTDRTLAGYTPPEVAGLGGDRSLTTIDKRWTALQRALHEKVTRRALLALPWPRRLGTPPWRVDNATRFAGVRFRGAMVDATDQADVRAMITHASAALRDGFLVPMYSSGHARMGLSSVVPRHVVLLAARTEDGFQVYEPATGAIHALSDEQMVRGGAPLRSLGNWTHVSWLVLPSARRRD